MGTNTASISRRQLLGLGASAFVAAGLAGCAKKDACDDRTDSSPGSMSWEIAPTEENVRLVGRTCVIDGVTWLPQSGSAIKFVVGGNRVQFDVVADESFNNEPDMRPRFAVLVDGNVVVDDTMGEATRTVEVDDIEVGSTVELMHLSEANCGKVGVASIVVQYIDERSADSTDAEGMIVQPIRPTIDGAFDIEFIGDSITCAYGVEAAGSDDPFKTTTQNFMKSYAYLTAKAFCANYSAVCYSGYGIVSGWSGDGTRNENMLMPPVYGLVSEGFGEQWDFESHTYHVIVINVGTNDFTYTATDEARMAEFADGYADFLGEVRELNPYSHIICTLGTMWGCEALYPALEKAVEAHKSRTGDDRVMCYLSDPIDMEHDGCGTGGHPNEVTQQKSADALVDIIREVLDYY